jgi:hypothetical protein
MSFTLGRMFVPPHLVPLQYLNSYVQIRYSCGTGCARSLEQFYMTIKRTHGISSGAQRMALKLRATPGWAQGALLGATPVNGSAHK